MRERKINCLWISGGWEKLARDAGRRRSAVASFMRSIARAPLTQVDVAIDHANARGCMHASGT